METTRGTLTLLWVLSEGPLSKESLLEALEDAGIHRDERTIRRWLRALQEAGAGVWPDTVLDKRMVAEHGDFKRGHQRLN